MFDPSMPARHAIAVEHDVVLAIAADRDDLSVEHVAPSELRRHRGVDDDEAVVPLALDFELLQRRNAGLDVVI
jgi:hypothetical protein